MQILMWSHDMLPFMKINPLATHYSAGDNYPEKLRCLERRRISAPGADFLRPRLPSFCKRKN